MNLFKTVTGLTKEYLNANKKSKANVHIQDECYNVSIIYNGLEFMEDDYFIHLGEYGSDSFDISIVKSKISKINVEQGSIVITVNNVQKFVINLDSECEISEGIYNFTPSS